MNRKVIHLLFSYFQITDDIPFGQVLTAFSILGQCKSIPNAVRGLDAGFIVDDGICVEDSIDDDVTSPAVSFKKSGRSDESAIAFERPEWNFRDSVVQKRRKERTI